MTPPSLLPASWNVPEAFRHRLGNKVGRQRPMVADGHLLLVLHRPPQPDNSDRYGRFLWRKPDGTWTASDLGIGPQVLSRHLEEYAELLDRYDQQTDLASTADEYFSVLEAVAPICRATRNLHQVLQEARTAFPQDRDLINARDRAYEIEREFELLYEGAKNALEFLMAKRAEEQALASKNMVVASHRLNLLVAFFFPLATLSALFGVNLVHGLEEIQPPLPFYVLVGGGLLAGLLLMLAVFGKTSSHNGTAPRHVIGIK